MTKSKKIAAQDSAQQKKSNPRQLSVTSLNHLAHGEERSHMRDGFYARRNRSQV